jgi:hypothetical protein
MPRDKEVKYVLRLKLAYVFSTLLFLEYEVPERVPFPGRLERLAHLEVLFNKNEDFLDLLAWNDALLERLMEGLK